MKKILVIAPHADDEVLGCGGYLLSESKKGSEIHFLIGTVGGHDSRQNFETRIGELRNVSHALKASYEIMFTCMDARLDTIESVEIISKIDKAIEVIRPDELFVNYPSLHQDHVKIYDCSLASLRMKEGYNPPFVALYEYPFILNQYKNVPGGRLYVDIKASIEDKVKLFYMYQSQVKSYPSPLNEEGIKMLAKIRGFESALEYAEMFYIQKMIV